MSEEKKPSRGPVVVRRGHVKPPPPGARIEPPKEEMLAPVPARTQKPDDRPLWQRLADEKAGVAQTAPRRPSRGEPRPRREKRAPSSHEPPIRDESDRPIATKRPAGAPPPAPEVEIPNEGTFAEMLDAEGERPHRHFKVGDKVAGKIIQLGQDIAFLELGSGVAEGMIDIAELRDSEGNVTAREGDIVDGIVVQARHRGVVISKGHGRAPRDRAREALAEAARAGLPVEGTVKGVNKGGLEVEVHGTSAFCPMSQIDIRFVGDPKSFVGQKLQFKVQKADHRDVVLSRRALLEEERAATARATREKLAPGAVFEGKVTSVQSYGAFVDLGGVEGLVHVSELSWDRASKPQDLLRPGDSVQVQVLKIEEDAKKGERVSLSVRALTPRPEPEAAGEAPSRPAPPPKPRPGDVVEATVDKIESFGLFVRFAGGRGLVPARETGTSRGADLRKAFKVGDTFQALIEAIDEQHRIRLSKTGAEDAAERKEAADYMRTAASSPSAKGFGTLGDLLRKKLEKE